MTRFSQHLHDALGALGQELVGRPGVVAVIPDDQLPQAFPGGPAGTNVGAGGAGVRSEIFIGCFTNSDPNRGVEISDIWVRSSTGAAVVEIVKPTTALAGFTDVPFVAGDMGLGKTLCRLFSKASAAATAGTIAVHAGLVCQTAGEYVRVPGRLILRGRPVQTGVIVRTTVDNQGVGVMFAYRELEKRAL